MHSTLTKRHLTIQDPRSKIQRYNILTTKRNRVANGPDRRLTIPSPSLPLPTEASIPWTPSCCYSSLPSKYTLYLRSSVVTRSDQHAALLVCWGKYGKASRALEHRSLSKHSLMPMLVLGECRLSLWRGELTQR